MIKLLFQMSWVQHERLSRLQTNQDYYNPNYSNYNFQDFPVSSQKLDSDNNIKDDNLKISLIFNQ